MNHLLSNIAHSCVGSTSAQDIVQSGLSVKFRRDPFPLYVFVSCNAMNFVLEQCSITMSNSLGPENSAPSIKTASKGRSLHNVSNNGIGYSPDFIRS